MTDPKMPTRWAPPAFRARHAHALGATSGRPVLRTRRRLRAAAAVLGLVLHEAHAAGGHHAVDDAALLEPGECQVETWFDRARGGVSTLVHAGSACRLGPVELGVNVDRARSTGSDAVHSGGPQLKWAVPVTPSLSAGVVVWTAWQDADPRRVGSSLVIPVTWQAAEQFAVHVNLGRDFRRHGPDLQRSGAALEWAALPQWSLMAERFRESGGNFWRVGARYEVNKRLSVDLSQARGLPGGSAAWWTLGVNWMVLQ